MRRTRELERYCKNFAEFLIANLKPKLSITATAYPSIGPGAVAVFEIKDHSEDGPKSNRVQRPRTYAEVPSVSHALADIKLQALQGDFSNMRFGGTNIFLQDNRIIIVKGDDQQSSWSKRAAHDDAKRILRAESERS